MLIPDFLIVNCFFFFSLYNEFSINGKIFMHYIV